MSGFIDTICFWLVKRRCAITLAAHVANAMNRKRFDTDWLKDFVINGVGALNLRGAYIRRSVYELLLLKRVSQKVFNLSCLLNSDGATCRKTAAAAAGPPCPAACLSALFRAVRQ